jgi:ADP-ribose pyrophosphatase
MKVFKGKKFYVEVKNLKLPSGKKIRFDGIVAANGVLIIPFVDKDTIILIKEFKPPVGKWVYQFPVGGIGKNEVSLTAARRELEEETGYLSEKMRYLGKFYVDPGYMNVMVHLFEARGLTFKKQRLGGYEVIRTVKVKLKNVKKLIERGTIKDGRTIAALFFLYIKR